MLFICKLNVALNNWQQQFKKMLSLNILVILLLIMVVFFTGCASVVDNSTLYVRIDETIKNNDFEAAIREMETIQASNRPLYNNKNYISMYINRGLLQYYAGNFKESSLNFHNAERLIHEAFTKSISENVASYIVNDNTKEYPGEDFEDIYISVFNALNYFKMGNLDGALVEIRKLTLPSGKLNMLERKYESGNTKAKDSASDEYHRVNNSADASRPITQSTTFTNSALARYLSVLFYQADGNDDAVRIELAQLKAAFESQPNLYTSNLPTAINRLTETPTGKARLDLLTFAGLSPIKKEKIFYQYFPFFTSSLLQIPQFKIPVLVERPNRIDRIEVVVNNERINMEMLEDISAVIIDTFNARFTNIFLKTYVRTLVKYTALDIANNEYTKKNQSQGVMGKLGQATALLTAKAMFDATEKADIRMSRYLPNRAYIGNILLNPGIYDVTINYYAQGNIIRTETFENVEVKQNIVNLINTVNLDRHMNTPNAGNRKGS